MDGLDLQSLWSSSGLGGKAVAGLALVALSLFIHLCRVYWKLKHIPGPFWAKITNLQRVYWVTTHRAHDFHQQVHDKYGEAVRFGPNMVSLSNPEWIPTVYPIRTGFPKAGYGHCFGKEVALIIDFNAGRFLPHSDALH